MLPLHGDWKIEVNNNVILQWFEGSWNEEAIIAYMHEFREVASQLVDRSWAILSVLEEWELCVPETEKHISDHAYWFIENGCTHDCHVFSKNEIKKMQLNKMIPTKCENYERRIFVDINESIEWLQSEGFELANTDFFNTLKNNKSPNF
jgi:hypothetical protein